MFVFAIDLAWAGVRAIDGFQEARDALSAGGTHLTEGQVPTAMNDFGAAASASAKATDALRQPAVAVAGWLPWFRDEIDAARRSTKAAALAAEGGTAFADAADTAGWNGTTVPGFAPGGRIDASALRRAGPDITRAADLLGQAQEQLAPVDPTTLMPPLDRLLGNAKDEIDARTKQAETASTLAGLLPSMLGLDGRRTYLLVTLSTSDPRAAGGYPGVFGLLHVNGRQIWLTHLAATGTIPKATPPVPGPREAKRIWGWAGIDRFFWDTTYTPDFPTAAAFMKGIWEASGGRSVDGVIAGDPTLMSALLGVVGPAKTPVWPTAITSDNVERIVGAEVYLTRSESRSNAWEVGIGGAMWDAVLTRPWPIAPMASAISDAVEGGHLRAWSVVPAEQKVLGELGVTGAFTAPTDAPRVLLNGFTANRAGYFSRTTTISSARGSGASLLTVRISSHAPTRPPSLLLGTSPTDVDGHPLGTFGADVNIYLPNDVRVTSFTVNGKRVIPFEWNELGAHVVSWSPLIDPGSQAVVTVTYRPG